MKEKIEFTDDVIMPQFEYVNNIENPKIDPEFKEQEQSRKEKRTKQEELKAKREEELRIGIYEASWIQVELPNMNRPYICSRCKAQPLLQRKHDMNGTYIDLCFSKYCPNCGKKMQPPLDYKREWW